MRPCARGILLAVGGIVLLSGTGCAPVPYVDSYDTVEIILVPVPVPPPCPHPDDFPPRRPAPEPPRKRPIERESDRITKTREYADNRSPSAPPLVRPQREKPRTTTPALRTPPGQGPRSDSGRNPRQGQRTRSSGR